MKLDYNVLSFFKYGKMIIETHCIPENVLYKECYVKVYNGGHCIFIIMSDKKVGMKPGYCEKIVWLEHSEFCFEIVKNIFDNYYNTTDDMKEIYHAIKNLVVYYYGT